jgi:hypothetical protein
LKDRAAFESSCGPHDARAPQVLSYELVQKHTARQIALQEKYIIYIFWFAVL